MTKYILASASPRRRQLLKRLIKDFRIVPSAVNESRINASSPAAFAIKAALAKAKEVAGRQKNAIVIGADTIVVLGRKILGKPKNKKEAVAMLKSLSGRTHKVITGLAVVNSRTGRAVTGKEVTKVRMEKVPLGVINEYVASGRPLDKAGAYGIQEIERQFGITVKGDYDNVVGLPVKLLKRLMFKLQYLGGK